MKCKFEGIWKEVAMVYFKVIPWQESKENLN
jgi:hypothetical protein